MPDFTTDHSTRFTELETSLAFQQRLNEQLNQIVCEHSQQIMILQRGLAEMSRRIKELHQQRKESPIDLSEEKPPHY